MKKTNITPVELARQRGQTLDWIYRQIRVGKIRATRQGNRWVIPMPVSSERSVAFDAKSQG
jgi:hypothetical protein